MTHPLVLLISRPERKLLPNELRGERLALRNHPRARNMSLRGTKCQDMPGVENRGTAGPNLRTRAPLDLSTAGIPAKAPTPATAPSSATLSAWNQSPRGPSCPAGGSCTPLFCLATPTGRAGVMWRRWPPDSVPSFWRARCTPEGSANSTYTRAPAILTESTWRWAGETSDREIRNYRAIRFVPGRSRRRRTPRWLPLRCHHSPPQAGLASPVCPPQRPYGRRRPSRRVQSELWSPGDLLASFPPFRFANARSPEPEPEVSSCSFSPRGSAESVKKQSELPVARPPIMRSALHDACSWRVSTGVQGCAVRGARAAATASRREPSSFSVRADSGVAAGSGERYAARGVSASKEDVHNAIKDIDKGLFPKAFCKARAVPLQRA